MGSINEFAAHFWPALLLIGIALVLTVVVFRRRLFERGPRKGDAKDPQRVRRENPPDQWSQSH